MHASCLLCFTSLLVAIGCEPKREKVVPKLTPQTLVRMDSGRLTKPKFIPPDSSLPLTDPPKLLTDDQLRDGWITLFDGKTLFGWVANSDTPWSVANGEIVSQPGTPGLLLTTSDWQDYELRCEAWLEQGGNGGLFLRTVPHPTSPAKDCLEFNLCDTHETFPTGSLVARVKPRKETKADGGWHAIRLVVEADRVLAEIDGETVLDETSPEFSKTGGARIGLQQNGGVSRFRNVFLRPLGTKPLHHGKPLASGDSIPGWKVVPASAAAFTTEGETIRVVGGPGFLETETNFGDFTLQFEAKLNAKDVNSGVFFRAEAGTAAAPSNGYELQLQNTIADGDRTKPADYGDGFGTGAIFRRQRARYVNASDENWFAVTLSAKGNHFATWVNGLPVADFTDDRAPDPNPRKGRRDAPGHLSLQGHDEKTDASFRNLRLAPLP